MRLTKTRYRSFVSSESNPDSLNLFHSGQNVTRVMLFFLRSSSVLYTLLIVLIVGSLHTDMLFFHVCLYSTPRSRSRHTILNLVEKMLGSLAPAPNCPATCSCLVSSKLLPVSTTPKIN